MSNISDSSTPMVTGKPVSELPEMTVSRRKGPRRARVLPTPGLSGPSGIRGQGQQAVTIDVSRILPPQGEGVRPVSTLSARHVTVVGGGTGMLLGAFSGLSAAAPTLWHYFANSTMNPAFRPLIARILENVAITTAEYSVIGMTIGAALYLTQPEVRARLSEVGETLLTQINERIARMTGNLTQEQKNNLIQSFQQGQSPLLQQINTAASTQQPLTTGQRQQVQDSLQGVVNTLNYCITSAMPFSFSRPMSTTAQPYTSTTAPLSVTSFSFPPQQPQQPPS